ncbi:hypothetical protein FA10DRAFT_299440 [Acaromyces ingoldii]|uniref:Pre-rRNA-processing protein RIX1 N-terminal domain-containing protein n=1 Tax=Acaromyces ingoldii TaxID=215250 RepID=A0A316YZC0_9BASI|nr:hypothetical protein FA10DRAFT_299440 [Acaromyces ingoldii]PWN94124.1 hypothetical protein FA10DRAFT_299440 [Acaromyces ingoldii]
MAAPLNRQAAHLLLPPSSSSSSSAEIAAESVLELRRSGVLQRLSRSEAPADATEVHRLLVRCDSLVGQDSRQGFLLARELLRALPWSHVSAHASKWVSSGIANLRYAPREIVGVLDILMGSASRDRPEYHRAVVAPNLASYAGAMLNVADSTQEPAVLLPLLGSLAAQVRLHPSSCRPLAPRIHKLCAVLLFDRGILVPQATKLLSALHLTGKGAAGAAELWSATMASVLAEARAAWAACSSTFVESQEWQAAANSTATTMMPPLPSDSLEALPLAQRRLGLLLGRPPMQGMLPCLLGEATSSPVPVPTGALYSLAHAILAVSPSSPPRQHPPVDASVHAAQVACLAGAHMSAINLLVALHLTVDRGVCSSRQADTVARLLAFVEGSHYSSAHRFVAFKAISMLGLPLDPQARLVLRASRACLAQISRLLLHTHAEQQQQQQQQASASTSRPTKRAKRAYESDDLGLASQERRGLADVDGDERAACMAAMACLPALFGLLTTYLTPEHHDLAHTTALLLAAVAEVSMASDSAICAASLSALADVVALSRGSLLALLMARAGLQGATAACSPDAGLRAAGAKLRGALDAALHPRLPLRLDLKLQQDEALPTSWTVSVGQQGEEDSLKLPKVEIEEQPGSNEATAMEQVLGIRPAAAAALPLAPPSPSPHPPSPSQQQQLRTASAPSGPVSAAAPTTTTTSSPSPAVTAATAAAIRERFSPDPVKPVRRPSTPRIGSPGASPDRKSNAASGGATTAAAAFMNSVARGGGGQSGAGSPTSALTPKISSPLAAGRKLGPERPVDEDTVMESAGGRRGGGAADDVDDDDDDDDEGIPELDLGSSDEEDE